MLKSLLALSLLGASTAHAAYPSASEVKSNFKVCTEQVEGWFGRFGQYVVSFDSKSAIEICNETPSNAGYNSFARETGCKVNGKRLTAGFYCQDIAP